MIHASGNNTAAEKTITKETEKQIDNFKKGFPFINLVRPATPGDGILILSGNERNLFLTWFDQHFRHFKVVKFVPASGAASRMFKKLFEFIEKSGEKDVPFSEIEKDKGTDSIWSFLTNIKKFAFYEDLNKSLKLKGTSVDELIAKGKFRELISELLIGKGLGYANLPKALLKFHRYHDRSRTALEEHLVEAAHYASDSCGISRIHFTISPEHIEKFNLTIKDTKKYYENLFGVKYDISHSIQEPATDTIAVDLNNEPVKNPDGSFLFRPAGHGALLGNLLIPEADIIFIKNIDNIVPDHLKQETYVYKRLIGGYLLFVRDFIFRYLEKAENQKHSPSDNKEAIEFIRKNLQLSLSANIDSLTFEEQTDELIRQIDRPIRVCGMVKNEGEPGGGPFWVKESSGRISLQIVESAQIDFKDREQTKISSEATHFNPVDIVCCIKNYKGEKYDLNNFVDPSTGLISIKSSGGKEIKAQELPGLWNGSMAGWISIFIEVPIITFNPVKTVNDLLRDEHQEQKASN